MKEISYTLNDLLTNDKFLKYVISESSQSDEFWEEIQPDENNEMNKVIQTAKNIINCDNEDKNLLDENEINLLKIRILNTLTNTNKK
ncbi:MAG: hypothetical protein GX102_10375 [Porphyromonadaceae bacterium]|nr:hypothetical protein [Porphyromonadaceae bacterium]